MTSLRTGLSRPTDDGGWSHDNKSTDEAFRDLGRKAMPAPRPAWRRAVPLVAVLAFVAAVGLAGVALHNIQQSPVIFFQHWPLPTTPTRLTVSGTTFGVAVTPSDTSQAPVSFDAEDVALVLSQDEGTRWRAVVSTWGPLSAVQPVVLDSQRAFDSPSIFTLALFPPGATAITPHYAASGRHEVGMVTVTGGAGTARSGRVFVAVSSDDADHQPRGFGWVDSQGQHHETP